MSRAAPARRDRPPADTGLLHCEDGLLDLFAEVERRSTGPQAETEPRRRSGHGSTQEYLLSYLQWLDADRAGLPDAYRERLQQALLRYGVHGLDRTPELDEAVVWMFRSFAGSASWYLRSPRSSNAGCAPRRTGAAGRRRDAGRLDRLAGQRRAASAWSQTWPATCGSTTSTSRCSTSPSRRSTQRSSAISMRCSTIRTTPTGPAESSASSPARSRCAPRCCGAGSARRPRLRRALLEVYTRRFYRIRELRDLARHRARRAPAGHRRLRPRRPAHPPGHVLHAARSSCRSCPGRSPGT